MIDRLRHELMRFLLRVAWSRGGATDVTDGLPRLSGADARAIAERLRAGDVILMGNNGRLTHVAVYVGGGEIVHAMATEKTMRGWILALFDAVRGLFRLHEPHIGVVEEPLAAFLDRFERDTLVAVRHRGVTADNATRAIAHVRALVGRPYDYLFARKDEAFYCTELVEEVWNAALGAGSVLLPTRRVRVPLLLDRDVIEPEVVLGYPGTEVVFANPAAQIRYGAAVR
jgi:hypothetical protein